MTAPVRAGLVGFGRGGRWFHAPFLASEPTIDLVAVVTRSPERRAELADAFPGVVAVDDVDALLEAGVELVTVSTPPEGRDAVVRRLLDAGVAVVVDKPFALDAAAARDLVAYARGRGSLLSVFHNRRWDSEQLTLLRALREGVVGETVALESAIESWEPHVAVAPTGGGYLADLGSHLVDQAVVALGPVRAVYGELRRTPGAVSETAFFAALHHESGVVSRLFGDCRRVAARPRLRLLGDTGSLEMTALDVQTEQVLSGADPRSLGDGWGVEPDDRAAVLTTPDGVRRVPRERGRWPEFYRAMAAAVRGAGAVPVEPEDAVRTAVILDAIRRSDAERAVVGIAG